MREETKNKIIRFAEKIGCCQRWWVKDRKTGLRESKDSNTSSCQISHGDITYSMVNAVNDIILQI